MKDMDTERAALHECPCWEPCVFWLGSNLSWETAWTSRQSMCPAFTVSNWKLELKRPQSCTNLDSRIRWTWLAAYYISRIAWLKEMYKNSTQTHKLHVWRIDQQHIALSLLKRRCGIWACMPAHVFQKHVYVKHTRANICKICAKPAQCIEF